MEFYADAFPEICNHVRSVVNISLEDAEGCVVDALGVLIERGKELIVQNPYDYVKTSAKNNGFTLHRQRARETQKLLAIKAAEIGGMEEPVSQKWAAIAVEEALDDVEADGAWVVEVVETAMEKLTAGERRVIRYLAKQDFNYEKGDLAATAADASKALDLTPAAFRKAKQRAYAKLKVEIPAAVEALGVEPPRRFVSAFEESAGTFMEEEDGD